MRITALLLALCATTAFAADEVAPAPASDTKAQIKELDGKIRTIHDQTIKDDADLAKLKTAADDARKAYDAAVETKLTANADYVALKTQIDELKGKGKEPKKEKKEKKAEQPAE